MRALIFIGLLLPWFAVRAQTGILKIHVIDKDSLTYPLPLTFSLKQNDFLINPAPVEKPGHYLFTDIPIGKYILMYEDLGRRTRGINVVFTRDTTIIINYPVPCKFVYVKGVKPKCIGGHTNDIIPIVYGLPSKKTMKQFKKGTIRLGGCMVTDCDPMYYCTLHNKDL